MNPALKTFIAGALLYGVFTETGIWTTLFLVLVFVDLQVRDWRGS